MTTLADFNFEDRYSKSISDLLLEFYTPALERASRYDRATGFFSSAVFTAIEAALSGFFDRGGRIRLICSPRLSRDDYAAVQQGYADRELIKSLNDDLSELDFHFGSNSPSSILRAIISRGVMDLRIVVPRSSGHMFHDKYGIFHDSEGNAIAFEGSINESVSGWTIYGNHESFQVFTSWDERVRHRVETIQSEFDHIWQGLRRELRVYEAERLPEVFRPREEDLSEVEAIRKFQNAKRFRSRAALPKLPGSPRELQDHQVAALNNWADNGYRGIISFVTGGGKTITALAAIRDWLAQGKPAVVLVPSQILVEQWLEESRKELAGLDYSEVQVGAGVAQVAWRERVRDSLDVRVVPRPALIVGVYDSARTEPFLFATDAHHDRLLLVCDEVHVVGARENRKLLDRLKAVRRLGLSATPERFRDEAGTDAIFSYFGPVLEPKFGIAEAILAGRLVPYSYNIRSVSLTSEESQEFDELTTRIRKVAMISGLDNESNRNLERLLQERANIVKSATNKVELAIELAKSKRVLFGHIIMYCNTLKQITEIRTKLYSAGIDSLEYHSGLSSEQRKTTLRYFTQNGGILAAVHCLDQGVDIPRVDGAIILASSSNPREYIQRRGRILRSAPDKVLADLSDVVVTKSDGRIALRSDIVRAREIAMFARNKDQVIADIDFLDVDDETQGDDAIETSED